MFTKLSESRNKKKVTFVKEQIIMFYHKKAVHDRLALWFLSCGNVYSVMGVCG